MKEFDKTNTGSLGVNEDRKSDKHPEYTGSINTTCPHCSESSDHWLSAWIKTAGPTARKPGSKFFSLSSKSKQPPKPKAMPEADFTDDSEIPF